MRFWALPLYVICVVQQSATGPPVAVGVGGRSFDPTELGESSEEEEDNDDNLFVAPPPDYQDIVG